MKVTSISYGAFEDCKGITKVAIPNSVKNIGNYAFYGCSALSTITGISQLEHVGSNAFSGTPWYNSLPDGIVYLGKVLYKYKGTMPANTQINIKDGIVSISSYAFQDCSGLVGIVIPQSVTEINDDSFYYCPNLNSITVAQNNTKYDSRGNCNAVIDKKGDVLVVGCKSTTFPSSVKAIGTDAFNGSGIQEVAIPSNIDSIADYAFRSSNLQKVAIGKGVRKIGHASFSFCRKLRNIRVVPDNPYFDSRENCNAIIEKSSDKLIAGCSTTTIPQSVKSIDQYAFYGVFDSIYAFTIPDQVESIGYRSFADNSSLRSVTIGKNVKEYGERTFEWCTALRAIHCLRAEPVEIDESVFSSSSVYDNATLYVPIGSRLNYMCTEGWAKFKHIVETDQTTGLEGDVFEDADSPLIYSVTDSKNKTCEILGVKPGIQLQGDFVIPTEANGYVVTGIGANAFRNKKGITRLSIPSTVTEIGNYALYSCSNLESLELPSSLKKIGNGALANLGKISNVVIPKSVNSIGVGAFYGDSTITSIIVEDGNAVYNSNGGCNAVIETATKTLIVGCQTTKIPNGITAIGNSAFYSQKKLKTIKLPSTVTRIENYAFSGSGLESITIPANVDSIGKWALGICRNLKTVTSMIEKPFAIDKTALYTEYSNGEYLISPNATLYIPVGTKSLYENTPGWNKFQNIVEFTPGSETTPGDVNGDGTVDGIDIVALSNIVLDNITGNSAADVNGDGVIDGVDIVALANTILGGSDNVKAKKLRALTASGDNTGISFETFSINAGEEKEVAIDMTNPNDNITLIQFDMVLPEGLSLKKDGENFDIDIAGRTTWRKHTLDARNNGGFIRFLMYSSSNALIEGSEGAVIKLKLSADEDFKGGDIKLENILLVTPEEKGIRPDTYVYSLKTSEEPAEANISVEPFNIDAGEEKEVVIDMTNPNDNITLMQFDLVLPEGLSLKKSGTDFDIDIAGRTNWRKHTLNARDNGSFIRFLMYSSSNALIEGSEGAAIKMTLVADENFKGGKIGFENILLVTPEEKGIRPANFEVDTSEKNVGIEETKIGKKAASKIYDLSGRRLTKPTKGINIIDGKKVLIK